MAPTYNTGTAFTYDDRDDDGDGGDDE